MLRRLASAALGRGCAQRQQQLAPAAAVAASSDWAQQLGVRWVSGGAAVDAVTEQEKAIAAKIDAGMTAASIRVQDTSGGCGAMYAIEVVSPEFAGLSIVKQHQLVTKLLAAEISEWHGFQLVTKAPSSSSSSS